MDENALKRKRELEAEASGAESSEVDMDIEREKPLEGIKKAKKQKTKAPEPEETAEDDVEGNVEGDVEEALILTKAQQKAVAKAEKRRDKRKELQERKKKNADSKKAQGAEFSKGLTKPTEPEEGLEEDEDDDIEDDDNNMDNSEDRVEKLDVSGLIDEGQSTAPSTIANTDSSTASVDSAASSTSSVPPSGDAPQEKKQKNPLPIDDKARALFQERLTKKLEAMRASRKADGPDGRIKNRAELIEARRKKEAERKLAKKQSIKESKEDEARQKAEEQLARIRGGSGSPSIFAPRSPESERNFNFGRVAWQDGQQLESTLSRFQETRKKKGKSDAKTALDAAQRKRERISGLDAEKRKDIEEKDLWLSAKKRAQGEKVFDDVNLLKKTLKRQEKQKNKSTQEWKERIKSVRDVEERKQKKREDNLKKRRDEKGQKKQKGKTKVKKPGKKVKRPGFEGTFKGK